jgi:hypothetical protein
MKSFVLVVSALFLCSCVSTTKYEALLKSSEEVKVLLKDCVVVNEDLKSELENPPLSFGDMVISMKLYVDRSMGGKMVSCGEEIPAEFHIYFLIDFAKMCYEVSAELQHSLPPAVVCEKLINLTKFDMCVLDEPDET